MTDSAIYKYEYTFENGLEISEVSTSFDQNHVYLDINRHGDCRYCMYSDNPHLEDTFFEGISDLLSQDMTSASNLYQIACGRFHKFDKFWKGFNENIEAQATEFLAKERDCAESESEEI